MSVAKDKLLYMATYYHCACCGRDAHIPPEFELYHKGQVQQIVRHRGTLLINGRWVTRRHRVCVQCAARNLKPPRRLKAKWTVDSHAALMATLGMDAIRHQTDQAVRFYERDPVNYRAEAARLLEVRDRILTQCV